MTDRMTLDQMTSDELDQLYDQLAALRTVARGYCPTCGRGDAAPTVEDWEHERQRAESAEESSRRFLAQRQEMAEERYIWQQRGDRAEATIARIRALHHRNEHTGDCEHCSERDYPDYSVPHPCPTITALDQPAAGPAATQTTNDRPCATIRALDKEKSDG